MKILILAANPRRDLNLDREIRDLRAVIENSRNRQEFEVEDALAVRVGDLQELLFRHRPQIVHFCGHGGGQQGLVFESEDGGEQWVRTEALSDLFRLFAQDIDCVLLNACYSEEQASAIVNHIDYVIGMNQEIRDDAAIAFSQGFYRALGYERTIEQAFEFGQNAIQLKISGGSEMRSATDVNTATDATRKAEVVGAIQRTTIPEHLKPILKIKAADCSRADITTPKQPLSQDDRATLQLEIDQSLKADASQQYRQKVQEFLADHQLSQVEEIWLEQLQKPLGLSPEAARQILAEGQQPLQQARDSYREMLVRLVAAEGYPFTPETETALQRYRQALQLTAQEIEAIAWPILESAQAKSQLEQPQPEQPQPEQPQPEQGPDRLPVFQTFAFQVPQVAAAGSITYRPGQASSFAEDLGEGVRLELVAVPGGEFIMGSPQSECERYESEGPQHRVQIQPFFMGKYPIIQAQWVAVAQYPRMNRELDSGLSEFKGSQRPVECISWPEAVEFCQRLAQRTGRLYRLPSEAEWEYACRAGTSTPFSCGETLTTDLANYDGSEVYGAGPKGIRREQTSEVGSFPPNPFGLYDLHGNVWEWCADHWRENYQAAPTDGIAWTTEGSDSQRVLRGGSWYNQPKDCRSANRLQQQLDFWSSSIGFRVVCSGG